MTACVTDWVDNCVHVCMCEYSWEAGGGGGGGEWGMLITSLYIPVYTSIVCFDVGCF